MTSLAGETKDNELLVSGLYPPGLATTRATPSRFETSPDGTLLIYPQGKNIVVRVSGECSPIPKSPPSAFAQVGLGLAKICSTHPLSFFILSTFFPISLNPFLIFFPHDFLILQSVEEPNKGFIFQGHKATTTAARFSPDGKLVASGDSTGFIKIWSWSEASHAIKKEIKVMGKCVTDIAWGPDSKRIGVAGDGGQRARCILALSGSDQSPDMSGHIKECLSIAYKQQKPLMMVTGGEDAQTIRHKGPPFRRESSEKKVHRGAYINCIRFSPDGSKYCSVGSDKKVAVYNTEDGAVLKTLKGKGITCKGGHAGGVYGCSWVSDTEVLTCSADKTARVWNVEDGTSVKYTIAAGKPTLKDMQVACHVSSTGQMFSLSLGGALNVLDASNPDAVSRTIYANNADLSSMAYDRATQSLVSGDHSGMVACWAPNAFAVAASGNIAEKMNAAVAIGGGRFYAASWDNVVRSGLFETGVYDTQVALGGQPKQNGLRICASNTSLAVIVSSDGIRLLRDGAEICFKESGNWKPTCCDISPDGSTVVVCLDNKNICTLAVDGDALGELVQLYTAPAVPTCIAYSPDGQHIAVGDKGREVQVWNVTDGAKIISGGHWKSHNSTVTCLAWNPNNTHVATGSMDQGIYIWTILSKRKKEHMPLAHMYGPVVSVAWKDENTLISAGSDTVIKTWDNVKLPVA